MARNPQADRKIVVHVTCGTDTELMTKIIMNIKYLVVLILGNLLFLPVWGLLGSYNEEWLESAYFIKWN